MSAIYTPASSALSLTEFVGTSGTTVTLNPPAPAAGGGGEGEGETITYSYNIISVAMNDSHAPTDLQVSFSDNTFTFSSTFPDMFDRTIKYLVYDSDNEGIANNRFLKTYLQVPRFQDLPELFTGVYEYIPPSVNTRQVAFTVVYDETSTIIDILGGSSGGTTRLTETWTFTIVENWQLAMEYLRHAIVNGTRAKKAISKYPELSL